MKLLRWVLLILAFCVNSREMLCADVGEETQTPRLTFAECYKKVAAYYPVLKKQNARIDVAVAERFQAFAEFLPSIRGVSSVTVGDNPVYVFSSLLNQASFTQESFNVNTLNYPRRRTNYNFALQGELSLFNAFQTISRIRSAESMITSAEQEAVYAKMETALLATEAYLNVVLSEKIYTLLEQVTRDSQNDIAQAKELKEKGVVLGADYFAARVIMGGMTQMLHHYGEQRRTARAILNILMGEDPLAEYEAEGDLDFVLREGRSLQEWISNAFKLRGDLAALRAAIRAQEEGLFREKTSFLPRVAAFGALEENTENWRWGGSSYLMGIRGGMDIVDPSLFPRVQKAKGILRALQYQQGILRDSIKRSLTEEQGRYRAVCENMPVVTEMLGDADQAVSLTLPLYQEGRKSIADLLEMRRAFLETNIARDQLMLHSETAHARLLFLAGALDERRIDEIGERIGKKKADVQ
jgi:outer membrane protein TolC